MLVIDSFQFEWQNCICSLDKCKNCDSVQVCRLNFQTMSEQSISFLRLKALCLAQEFQKIAEMTRHDLWLQVYFQLGCHLNHCNVSHCFLQLILLTKRRTTQWVYEKTIAKSKFIQNTCSGSWFLCKEWKHFTLSEATLGRHLCSTNHVGARLNLIMIPLKMAERSSISCDPPRYRNRVDICFIPKFSRQECALFNQIYFNWKMGRL